MVISEGSFIHKTRRPLPIPTDPTKIWARRFLATNYFQVYIFRVERLIEACNALNIDGVLWTNRNSFTPAATDAMIIEKAIKERLGLPMMILDCEAYGSRYNSSFQLRTRIESFAEILRSNKAAEAK